MSFLHRGDGEKVNCVSLYGLRVSAVHYVHKWEARRWRRPGGKDIKIDAVSWPWSKNQIVLPKQTPPFHFKFQNLKHLTEGSWFGTVERLNTWERGRESERERKSERASTCQLCSFSLLHLSRWGTADGGDWGMLPCFSSREDSTAPAARWQLLPENSVRVAQRKATETPKTGLHSEGASLIGNIP